MDRCKDGHAMVEEQEEKDRHNVEGRSADAAAGNESRRCAGKTEASVGSAEWEEVRQGVAVADRHAAREEMRREGAEADRQTPDRGLGHEMAAEEGRIARVPEAPGRITQATREEHKSTDIPDMCPCHIAETAGGGHGTPIKKTEKDKTYREYFQANERGHEKGSTPWIIVTDEDTGDTYARAVGGKGVGEHRDIRLAYLGDFP